MGSQAPARNDMEDDEQNERIEVRGYIYTHWDCPHCGSVHEVEGDGKGDADECQDCGCAVTII